MEVILPTGCGNSPRLDLVGEFVVSWAVGNEAEVLSCLADDATWRLVGSAGDGSGEQRRIPWSSMVAEKIEILSTVTHGRLAACDGYLAGPVGRADFAHMLRFTGAAKTARIAEVRTFLHPR